MIDNLLKKNYFYFLFQLAYGVKSYNGIIKNNVNRLSFLIELECTIERLLEKESQFVRLNETTGKLPASQEEDYHNHYFKEVNILYQ